MLCTLKATEANFRMKSPGNRETHESRSDCNRFSERQRNPLNLWHHGAEICVMNLKRPLRLRKKDELITVFAVISLEQHLCLFVFPTAHEPHSTHKFSTIKKTDTDGTATSKHVFPSPFSPFSRSD